MQNKALNNSPSRLKWPKFSRLATSPILRPIFTWRPFSLLCAKFVLIYATIMRLMRQLSCLRVSACAATNETESDTNSWMSKQWAGKEPEKERERGEHSQAGPCRTVGVRSQHTHNIPSRGAPNSKNIQTEEKRVSRSHTATITKRRRSAAGSYPRRSTQPFAGLNGRSLARFSLAARTARTHFWGRNRRQGSFWLAIAASRRWPASANSICSCKSGRVCSDGALPQTAPPQQHLFLYPRPIPIQFCDVDADL